MVSKTFNKKNESGVRFQYDETEQFCTHVYSIFNAFLISEEISNRRPATPAMSSRPQTPIVQSSRPQTPRIRSRPTTPTHAPARSTPTSRPNTPQYSISPRPKTPSSLPATVCNRAMTYSTPLNIKQRPSSKEDGDIKSTYISKRKLFHNLKKELDLKQVTTYVYQQIFKRFNIKYFLCKIYELFANFISESTFL